MCSVMREQLANTDNIRRVRKKAPCTRRELWEVQKQSVAQQMFCEPSLPGTSLPFAAKVLVSELLSQS
jgi:cohesin complex subunit SCC1